MNKYRVTIELEARDREAAAKIIAERLTCDMAHEGVGDYAIGPSYVATRPGQGDHLTNAELEARDRLLLAADAIVQDAFVIGASRALAGGPAVHATQHGRVKMRILNLVDHTPAEGREHGERREAW